MSVDCACIQDTFGRALLRNVNRYNVLIALNSDDPVIQEEINFIKNKISGFADEVFEEYGLENPISKKIIRTKSVGLFGKLFNK